MFLKTVYAEERQTEILSFDDFAVIDTRVFPGQGSNTKQQPLNVELSLESESIVPGIPFTLLLALKHQAGVYSYWVNPGGPGMATKISWELPEGFTISEAKWPSPELYNSGNMVFYVYKDTVYLVFTVMPPEDLVLGTAFNFKGSIETQACTPRNCTPMRISVEAKGIAAEKPGDSSSLIELARSRLPVSPEDWRIEVMHSGDNLTVHLRPMGESIPEFEDIYFFDSSASPLIDSQKPQRLKKEGDGWQLNLPRVAGESVVGKTLSGVLRTDIAGLGGQAQPRTMHYQLSAPINDGDTAILSGMQRPVEHQVSVLLAFAFLGGLLLNVMPCVFPVIGLKIMGFAKQAHKARRAVFLHGLAYTAGVLLCFWTLSFLVITMGRGWGAQLQSEWVMLAMCHIFMIMALNMAGVFEVGASVAGAGQGVAGSEGLRRSFFTGLLATLTSTPCSAPFLGTALAYALSLPPLLSLGVFTLMGLGFSFPYLALSLFPSWLKKLPKPGAWMDTFRQAMCFPLFATTAYLFWTMEAMVDEWRYLLLLFGLVLTAMACWLYGKHQRSFHKRPRMSRTLLFSAFALFAAGIWLGLPKAGNELEWEEWSPEVVARLREAGRPVYVDFTARWCATCQLNKRVYSDDDLRGLIEDKNVALLKADWTLYDERITHVLRDEFDKAAVPVTVLYAPGISKGTVLPDILTIENVKSALEILP